MGHWWKHGPLKLPRAAWVSLGPNLFFLMISPSQTFILSSVIWWPPRPFLSWQPSIATGLPLPLWPRLLHCPSPLSIQKATEYSYELEWLRIQYQASQESLWIECEWNVAEQELFTAWASCSQGSPMRWDTDAICCEYGYNHSKGKWRM